LFRREAEGGGDMRQILGCFGLALTLVLAPVALAQDKKADPDKPAPKPDKNAPKTEKEAVDKLHVGGEISGKLISWGAASDKSFSVRVTLAYYEFNKGEYDAMIQEQVYASQLNRSAQDRLNHAQSALQHQAKLYTSKSKDVDVNFVAAADMKVRTRNPLVFDDKGKPKKLSQMTKKEKDELKGPDKSLPGYTADMADVHADQYVTVYIPKKKPGKPNKDEKGLLDNKPEAIMLVILGEAPAK
jgi:hypothetical protein